MDKLDWEVNPENYATDENGEFVLKKDGTPKKKAGRAKGSKGKGYNYHSETKAKLSAKRTVRAKQKKLKAAQGKVDNYKKSIENTKKTLDVLSDSEKSKLFSAEELEALPKSLREEAEECYLQG